MTAGSRARIRAPWHAVHVWPHDTASRRVSVERLRERGGGGLRSAAAPRQAELGNPSSVVVVLPSLRVSPRVYARLRRATQRTDLRPSPLHAPSWALAGHCSLELGLKLCLHLVQLVPDLERSSKWGPAEIGRSNWQRASLPRGASLG
eukprot:723229-Rhodomonas_salina.2